MPPIDSFSLTAGRNVRHEALGQATAADDSSALERPQLPAEEPACWPQWHPSSPPPGGAPTSDDTERAPVPGGSGLLRMSSAEQATQIINPSPPLCLAKPDTWFVWGACPCHSQLSRSRCQASCRLGPEKGPQASWSSRVVRGPPPQGRGGQRTRRPSPAVIGPICKQRPAPPGRPQPHTPGDRVFGHSETLTQPPLFSRLNEGAAKIPVAR